MRDTLALELTCDGASREAYRSALVAFFRSREASLSDEAKALIDVNPLRILDSKRPADREVCVDAPDIIDSLSDDARAHFTAVQDGLNKLGVEFDRDSRLVRGLDYYTGTIFEFTTSQLGAQDAILGGGRYDGLVEELGGPSVPAIGFAAGVERLALLIAAQRETQRVGIYVAPCNEAAVACLKLSSELRSEGHQKVEMDVIGGRLKQQLKRADRSGARWMVIVGENEFQAHNVLLKDLVTGEQRELPLNAKEIIEALSSSEGD